MHSTSAEREHERVGAIMSVAFGVYWETASGLVSRNIYLFLCSNLNIITSNARYI